MKKISTRTKALLVFVFIIGLANMNTVVDYLDYADHALIREMRSMRKDFWDDLAAFANYYLQERKVNSPEKKINPSEEYSEYLDRMKREDRQLIDRPADAYRAYLENRDVVVRKHIPLGISAEAAMEICRQNGFDIYAPTKLSIEQRSNYPNVDEYIYCVIKDNRWYWIGTDEYRVFLYLKNKQVWIVAGAQFSEALGGL